ncbi:MAG: helix-turn-helix domain-containing protein [Planctomycetes bacterium]|nr:helix-turn-helix domain-containing protein [Planctomycetota bacterium]
MGSKHALHTDRYAAFLDRLRAARRDRDMTQEEVADVLGKPQTYVSKCELGERRVDFVELEDFAAAYGLPLDYFVTRSAGSRRSSSTTRRSSTQRKR